MGKQEEEAESLKIDLNVGAASGIRTRANGCLLYAIGKPLS